MKKKVCRLKYPAEIRRDYIQEKYVIIAPRRDKRPHDTERPERARPVTSTSCVLCFERVEKNLIIQTFGQKKRPDIMVIKNKFPALTLDNPKAYGVQEVIIETPDHAIELDELSITHIAKLLKVYAIRTKEISKNKKIEYILIFKNNGGRAGASLVHSHSQIFATDFLPPHLFDKSQKIQAYKLEHGTCVYCDVIKNEIEEGCRMIYEDKYVIAFTPYASLHNYEAWILPKRHLDNITRLNEKERMSWAKALKKILRKISRLDLPYNFYFHQIIYDEDQHLYMKITPRGSVWAGVEIGSGLIINPVSPEEAAAFYRK